MSWRSFVSLLSFSILALILIVVGKITGETEILYAFALAVLSVGLGFNSLMISLNTDKKMNNMEATLTRIEDLQGKIDDLRKEQPGSQKPLLATLEGLSQYYLDYIAKQKGTDEK